MSHILSQTKSPTVNMSDDVGPPRVLDERSLAGVARYIQSNKCKKIFVMVRTQFL